MFILVLVLSLTSLINTLNDLLLSLLRSTIMNSLSRPYYFTYSILIHYFLCGGSSATAVSLPFCVNFVFLFAVLLFFEF